MLNADYSISDHFYDRAKSRVGLPKKGVERLIKNALYDGIYMDYLDPYSKLYKLMNAYTKRCNTQRNKERYVVYFRRYIILFEKPNIAVTILYAPESIVKCAKDYYKRRLDDGCNTIKSIS
jgi:hypothetical protein